MLLLRAEGLSPSRFFPAPGSLAQGLEGPAPPPANSRCPSRQPGLPLIYCALALFGAIKLSCNGNMFLFSHICRMKVNIFIILPSSPQFSSLALHMWA